MTGQEAINFFKRGIAFYSAALGINGCDMQEEWQKTIDAYTLAVEALKAGNSSTEKDTGLNDTCADVEAVQFVPFESLCGKHMFSGCEIKSEEYTNDYGTTEHVGVCLFTLDGVTHKAIEDPSDGYRSYCRDLRISDIPPRYSFPGIEVLCSMMEDSDYGHNNGIVLRDGKNGKEVLAVGTKNYDDWYPICVFSYTPENMSCNEEGDNEEQPTS